MSELLVYEIEEPLIEANPLVGPLTILYVNSSWSISSPNNWILNETCSTTVGFIEEVVGGLLLIILNFPVVNASLETLLFSESDITTLENTKEYSPSLIRVELLFFKLMIVDLPLEITPVESE